MPIQIDHIDTTVEVTAPSETPAAAHGGATVPTTTTVPVRALSDVLMNALADEFLRYARSRGR